MSKKLLKLGTLDYHNTAELQKDNMVKLTKWTRFTDPLHDEDCFKEFNTKSDIYRAIKEDLTTMDSYSNFTYDCLDSQKIHDFIY